MRIITAIFVLIVFTLLKILITKNNVSIFKKAPNLNWSGAFYTLYDYHFFYIQN